jgi:hypothetical protein
MLKDDRFYIEENNKDKNEIYENEKYLKKPL